MRQGSLAAHICWRWETGAKLEPSLVGELADAGRDGDVHLGEMAVDHVEADEDESVRTQRRSDRHLTARAREVVALVGRGMSNDEIAEAPYLSPLTARTHVSRAMTKLHARDRAQLVVIALRTAPTRVDELSPISRDGWACSTFCRST